MSRKQFIDVVLHRQGCCFILLFLFAVHSFSHAETVLSPSLNHSIEVTVTTEEKQWLKSHPLIRLGSESTAERLAISRKWMGVDSGTVKLTLSPTEQQWLDRHKTIRFTGDPNWLPYEAFDKQGNYIGIVAEHLRLIEQKLGIKVEIIPTSTWSDSVVKVKQGEVDVLSETRDSDLKSQLSFTHTYLSSPIIIVMKNDEDYVENIDQIKQKKNSGY